MNRRIDWPERLAEYIAAVSGRLFAWGEHDCALFASGAVAAMTGIDPAGFLRGQYATANDAAACMAALGKDFEAAISTVLDTYECKEIAPAFAQRGDLLLCASGLEEWPEALGVCVGDRIGCPGKRGMLFLPINAGRRAWRI